MANAVISRTGGATPSVTLPLLAEDGLLVARDVGKPGVNYHAVGREDPLPRDHFSAADRWTVTGILHGSSAYADAQTLAEDIVKPQLGDSDELSLDLSDLSSHSTYEVAADTAAAARFEYVSGVRELVGVQLSLSAVNDTFAASGQTAQATQSPDAGSGVKITDGSNPITISKALHVTRSVGRPESNSIQRPGTLPNFYDLNKPAVDTFEVRGTLFGTSAESDAQTLEETLVRARQGTGALTLHFLGNEFGLDAYDVMPDGSQALRTTFSAGERSTVRVETLNLRVVDTQ